MFAPTSIVNYFDPEKKHWVDLPYDSETHRSRYKGPGYYWVQKEHQAQGRYLEIVADPTNQYPPSYRWGSRPTTMEPPRIEFVAFKSPGPIIPEHRAALGWPPKGQDQ